MIEAKPEMTASVQLQLLAPVPVVGRAVVLRLRMGSDVLRAVAQIGRIDPTHAVVGIGAPLVLARQATIPGLRAFPAIAGPGCVFPSTQGALYVFVAADDPGELHDRSRVVLASLEEDFAIDEDVTMFRYRGGRDLTGYLDGTENPTGEGAVAAAVVSGTEPGLDGSSFVAVQRWVHALDRFGALAPAVRDATIGRRISNNEEIADAPAAAHVKRAAQESFDPPAFMLRRSMPFREHGEAGLFFVAYGESLDRFERVLRRMAGLEDGVVDALLTFSRAVSGGYYWCPPVRDGLLDLRRL